MSELYLDIKSRLKKREGIQLSLPILQKLPKINKLRMVFLNSLVQPFFSFVFLLLLLLDNYNLIDSLFF